MYIEDIELYPKSRVPSNETSISGKLRCPRVGHVHFVWNNAFSWFTNKSLSYTVRLELPPFQLVDKARAAKARSLLVCI